MTLAPRLPHLLLGSMLLALAASSGPARAEGDTPIPPSLTTPDQVGTSIGTLKFRDGIPMRDGRQDLRPARLPARRLGVPQRSSWRVDLRGTQRNSGCRREGQRGRPDLLRAHGCELAVPDRQRRHRLLPRQYRSLQRADGGGDAAGLARLVRRSLVPLGDRFRHAGPRPRHGRKISPDAAGL